MELLCPNCQRKLTIPDQYGGQLMKCPLCTNTFTAPALAAPQVAAPVVATPPPPPAPLPAAPPAPPPMVAPPPPPPVETSPFSYPAQAPAAEAPALLGEGYGLASPEPPPPFFGLEPPMVTAPPVASQPAPPPPPPGEYTRSCALVLSSNVVPWITPLCLTLLFFLSFTVWYGTDKRQLDTLDSPWHWALIQQTEAPKVPTLAFKLFLMFSLILAWPLSIVSLLMQLQVVVLPAGLRGLRPLRPLLVGIPAVLGFGALAWVYLPATFHVFKDFGTFGLRLAVILHIFALIGLGLDQWLEKRRQRNLPPPRIEMRW